ncbi:helix-turn-helix domain-containing protein [Streptomyces violens]|uniref:helix-turn-helix domain-containing protein n=1 Tax=Streptomyces violens TaxID=66377 RepID=UPI0004BEA3D1|nr:helix-turn-helix domain-containing protein [Streptomyces violens]
MAEHQKNHDLPRLYPAADVAEALDCSEWWVKEQARRRRIPFIKSGSGYRFTKDHVQEILHILEERPEQTSEPDRHHSAKRRQAGTASTAPVVQLRARRPRRAQNAA